MKTFGFCIALLTVTGLFAQNHNGLGNRGSVSPGRFNNGWAGSSGSRRTGGVVVAPYAYPVAVPVYVGGYASPFYGGYDPSYYDSSYYSGYDPSYGAANYNAPPAQPQQPANVIVIYPPAPAYGAAPPPGQPAMMPMPPGQPAPEGAQQPASTESEGPSHYLIAFKDHSIYTAVAYWVDGDTLHYFTSGNTHNQVSLSLVDRDLTKRLNEESGLQVNLPPAK